MRNLPLGGVWWRLFMTAVGYRYELRRGGELVATGRLSRERPLEPGQQVEVAGYLGTVQSVEPILGSRELNVVITVESR